jgi:PAS domain S-box-containing protein
MDDTEGREARQALRAGEEKYKALFDESVAAVFVLDRDKNFTDANRAALELLGYSREELLSLNFRDALPEPGGMNIAFQQLLSGGRILNYEHAMRRKDGRTAFVLNNSRPLTDEFGSVRGMLCTVVDITGPKTMRERLQRNQERYQRLVENLKDEYFFYSHDTDGMFTYISPSITSILGYTPQEFMTHYTEYLADDPGRDDVIRATQLSIQGMEQPSYEVKLRHKNGTVFTFEVKEYPIFNDYGEPVGVEGLARDITARKRADAERDALQEQLLQSQKMEAVGQLAGGIAHDFNNILAVMLGSAELVLRRIPTDDPNRERVQKILDSGRRAKDLTLQMLTFSRKDKLHVQSVPINELTEELTDMLQRGISKKIVIKKDFSPEPPIVTVDVNQVIQALLNICINASDAMGKAGTLTIATSEETVSESVARGVSGAKPGAYGVVTVRDTGPGIPQDVKARIFEPFFTTREQGKGTGLGLSVALGIIHNHEGFITVDSEPDKGACFKVFLPIGTEESRIAKRAASPVQEHKQGATVLLIDDNAEFLQMGEDILTVLGYKAIKARSGREALSLYSDHRGRVDLVILDMMMPEMDGSDVFDALTSLDPQVKIVLCSGYSLEGVAGRLLKDGAAAFLQKPFDIKEFSEILSHVVSSPQ